MGTLFVKGDLKQMSPEYLRGVNYEKYGTSMFCGVGVPIPILNEGLAKKTAIKDEDIKTDIVDYGVPRRDRPVLGETNYKKLKEGTIEVNGKEIKCSAMSSLHHARKIALELKKWIEDGKFFLNPPAETLPKDTEFNPMRQTSEIEFVKDLKQDAVICYHDCDIEVVAEKIIEQNINHIVITDRDNHLKGIVTSFDITKAVAKNDKKLKDIITKKVITTSDNEPVEVAARKMKKHNISALPVIDDKNYVQGIISSEDLM
jgi:CBS domain-containing protein